MPDRSIRVRRDHRQPSPISTFLSEKPTFIAWLAPSDTKCALTWGSRKAAIQPLGKSQRYKVFAHGHHGHCRSLPCPPAHWPSAPRRSVATAKNMSRSSLLDGRHDRHRFRGDDRGWGQGRLPVTVYAAWSEIAVTKRCAINEGEGANPSTFEHWSRWPRGPAPRRVTCLLFGWLTGVIFAALGE